MSPEEAATAARKAGNKALVEGRAEEAHAAYTEGLAAKPADHLLLGNRCEANLALGRAEDALRDADACLRHSGGSWPKGYLRKANSELALGRTADALRTLRMGLRVLPEGESRTPWLDKIASVKSLHFRVRVALDPLMGRVLKADAPFVAGEEVFTEHPIVSWTRPLAAIGRQLADNCSAQPDKPMTINLPEPPQPSKTALQDAGADADEDDERADRRAGVESGPKTHTDPSGGDSPAGGDGLADTLAPGVREICDRHQVHPGFAVLLQEFVKLSREEQDVVLSCCCPLAPLAPATVSLVNASNGLARLELFKGLGQMKVLKLLMISKVNSHQLQATKAGIYEVASKMAHSCSPNTLYDGARCRFIAVKDIPKDSLVTFSYNSSRYLVHSSEVRQTILRQSHLFVCKCERCVGVDRTRGIRCDCGKGVETADHGDQAVRFRTGTALIDRERGVPGARAWHCEACGGTWADEDMAKQLKREGAIEAEVHSLEALRDDVEKGQYEKLKDLVERSLSYLSRDHWCYMKLCCLLAHYHYRLARKSAGSASELLQLSLLWGLKYSQALVRTKVAEHAPMLSVEWDYWMSLVCGSWPQLMQQKIQLLEAVHPTYSTVYPDDPTTKKIAEVLAKSKEKVLTYKNKVFLGKAYKALNYDYDEGELFDRWENHLADRYVEQARKDPNTNLRQLLADGKIEGPEIN
ncbi:STI1-like protein [Diplonema papillatum]|nr:STI1-like protein [Diplonema papillatum]